MEWVNYHHLLYFWLVAREGGLARASAELRLAQSTVSKQIHQLEDVLGHPLFAKKGRRLALTESGQIAYRYAEEIFALGREMLDTLKDRPVGRPLRVTVGVADAIPKLVAERFLAPALRLPEKVLLVCREGSPARLVAELALHELDLVLSDAPAGADVKVRAFNHALGTSGITFFAPPAVARRARQRFPACLEEITLLLPTETTALRRRLDQWFARAGIRPTVAAEFDDAALLDAFGLRGAGAFPAATATAKEVERQYRVRAIGEVADVRESYYAITVERKIVHPAVIAIREGARALLAEPE